MEQEQEILELRKLVADKNAIIKKYRSLCKEAIESLTEIATKQKCQDDKDRHAMERVGDAFTNYSNGIKKLQEEFNSHIGDK